MGGGGIALFNFLTKKVYCNFNNIRRRFEEFRKSRFLFIIKVYFSAKLTSKIKVQDILHEG